VRFIREQRIQILHAHGSALFMANLAAMLPPFPTLVWHDHFGRYAVEERPVWQYRLLTRLVRGVIAVNQPLADWSCRKLGMPSDRVWYIPNFACDIEASPTATDLPGREGRRIVSVANFRPEKDHLNLVRAMSQVTQAIPDAHLLLIGVPTEPGCVEEVEQEIERQKLANSVTVLGQRDDVGAVLKACEIGVLSSASEGLPLSLLEYGSAGLPSVATQVGQCAEVLDHGRAGILVPPRNSDALASALVQMLSSPERRRELGSRFRQRIEQFYSPQAIVRQIGQVYETALASS
jgi:glycosyltransferase involved in cell wall biosynthesis